METAATATAPKTRVLMDASIAVGLLQTQLPDVWLCLTDSEGLII